MILIALTLSINLYETMNMRIFCLGERIALAMFIPYNNNNQDFRRIGKEVKEKRKFKNVESFQHKRDRIRLTVVRGRGLLPFPPFSCQTTPFFSVLFSPLFFSTVDCIFFIIQSIYILHCIGIFLLFYRNLRLKSFLKCKFTSFFFVAIYTSIMN